MDTFNFLSLFLLTSAVGCADVPLLTSDSLKGLLGKNITFNTTFDVARDGQYMLMRWTFEAVGSNLDVDVLISNKDKLIIQPPYAGRLALNQATGVLQLSGLTGKDSGRYTLTVTQSDLTERKGMVALEVLEPVGDVTIVWSVADVVELNSTVNLTCIATGSYLKYQWSNNSAPLVADGTHVVQSKSGNVLTIKDVWRTDLAGPITCQASNELHTKTSGPYNLTVYYGPDPVVLRWKGYEGLVFKTGSNLSLSCASESKPAATYQWMFNGVPVKDASSTAFSLNNMQQSQSGIYSCLVYNAKTKRYSSSQNASITVLEPISGTTITGPTSLLFAGNSTAQLICKAAAGTITSQKWHKDGKPLASSDRVNISGSALTISPVQKEDAGQYECHLWNAVNSNRAAYWMEIIYGPVDMYIQGPKKVQAGKELHLKCEVSSFPGVTYSWKLNGTVQPVTTREYSLEKTEFKDAGTYTCSATNLNTTVSNSADHVLGVTEGPVDEGLSGGAIAGIIIAVVIALAIIICVAVRMRRSKDIPSPY
ncbi:carcinoembryonic antigen-related cell adhesion molecule 5 isoform X2 [Denticeps clupeoides]|uniref:Ig-like domain-containing protein n=1 Tax=Denticeps clupeoides TaxID=299321 RepID=A0AAY4DRA9_9TELE|nr:carcinoembryonic antigen-related cell adhesion molecule 5-like isoform X2 [Denticeps clupeoides]